MNRFFLAALVFASATPAFAQQDEPLPARVAAQKMTLPPGFKATLFAGEPDVVQPIAFCFDDRGRVWVAECLSYPNWEADPKKGKDRIIILEDTDGDGVHDKRTVFANNIQNISGINYGFGGVWVCASPNLLYIPIKDGDKPGEPEIVLDGWSLQMRHNVFNSLTWGPDGWLYGCNGIIATSKIGPPGTPDAKRVAMNCGVWRCKRPPPTPPLQGGEKDKIPADQLQQGEKAKDPPPLAKGGRGGWDRGKFEVVAHGTTNPWGLDFDEHGEMFITNCVIDHLWHIVPGGHYQRMYGNDFNPHVYKLMPSICDHLHWGGGSWTSSRHPTSTGKRDAEDAYKVHSAAGGGHAHVGCMIYLGDNWPDRYRGGVFMCNLHGNRINHDILERNGSTYVARHAKDFMHANDPWFRGLAIHYGPDGGVYVCDWTDTGECHNYKIADKTNGRIFKITYGDVKPWKGDLAKLSDLELVNLQMHRNQWIVRHARRILQERAMERKIEDEATKKLDRMADDFGWWSTSILHVLHATKRIDSNQLLKIVAGRGDENVRVRALRLAMDLSPNDDQTDELLNAALKNTTPVLRLHVASICQNLKAGRLRNNISWLLFNDMGDSNDPYLPLMYWYAIEPSILAPNTKFVSELFVCPQPLTRQFISRKVAIEKAGKDDPDYDFDNLFGGLNKDPATHRDVLRGVQDGLAGRRNVKAPYYWKRLFPELIESPLPEVRERALALAVQFGDERAFTLLRKIVPDRAHALKERESALKTLLFQQKADFVPVLHDLLNDESLRGQAIRGLAAFDHAETPKLLVKGYAKWNADQKSDVIQTLAARSNFALALLDAIDTKVIPRGDINSFTIRQLQTLKSPEVSKKLANVWGEVRPASADKAKLMAKYKADLKPDVLKKANLSNGRALFNKACANCHRLFGEGGAIGPDLTGAQRTNLDYILENVIDPSAIVPREGQVTIVETKNGRTFSGIVKMETDQALTLQLQNEVVIVPKGDIETRTATKVSMMPEGAFDQMRIEEVRDLVAYLVSPGQTPLKK